MSDYETWSRGRRCYGDVHKDCVDSVCPCTCHRAKPQPGDSIELVGGPKDGWVYRLPEATEGRIGLPGHDTAVYRPTGKKIGEHWEYVWDYDASISATFEGSEHQSEHQKG